MVSPSNLNGLGRYSLFFRGDRLEGSVLIFRGLYLVLYSVSPSNLNLEGLYSGFAVLGLKPS